MAAERQSQAKKRKSSNLENREAKRIKQSDSSSSSVENEQVAGKIKRIFMKNFMCHDAMEVNFNQNVNFIVGANGSGKSAILTALTIGLGARAKATDRGPSVKEFIKKGKNSALIEITITNEGPMAYKYETYGNFITVIRSISTSSSYKIKNWRGEIVSTKREELQNITNFLNIQVENPISVLNQDVSRTFLVTAGPSDKYKLFMKATRLDIIGDNYKAASQASETTRQQLDEAQKFLSENKKEIEQIKKKLKALESLVKIREDHKNLQCELLWASVIEEEKRLLEIDLKIKHQKENLDKLTNLETTKAMKEQKIDSEIEELKKEIVEIEAEASNGNIKLTEIKKSYTEAKTAHDTKKDKARNLHSFIKRKETDVDTLQNEIKKLERNNSAAAEKKQQAKEEILKCEQKLDEVEATLRTKQTDVMHHEENKRRLEQNNHKIKIDLDEKNKSLWKLKNRLHGLQNTPNDALTVYGPNMPRLLRRIDEEYNKKRFKQKPLGPLGSFIKLKDPSWIPAIENHLGYGTLTLFCVDNGQDARILEIIMKEVFRDEWPPQVVISKFFNHVHDVSNGCTRSPKYKNLLDAMEISHPVIANALIDQREIECILLIATSDEACAVMSDKNRVPYNCRRAITKNADLFFPDPNYRTYGGSTSRPKFLQVSTSEAIQLLKEEIGVAEDELQIVVQDYNAVTEKIKNNKIELEKVQGQVKTLIVTQQQLKNKVEELKEVIEMCNNDTVNMYATEVEELQRILVQKKEEESHMLEEVRQSQKNLDSLNAELRRCRDLTNNIDARLNPIKENIKDLKNEKQKLKMSNQSATRHIEEAKLYLQQLNGEHQQQQRVLNSKIEIGERSCPRINTNKSVATISSRIKELKITIETVEKQHGSRDTLLKELEEKQAKYGGVQDFAVELTRSNNKQLERLKRRKAFYYDMKKTISQRVQHSFTNVLYLRNYKGKIVIDHQKKELHLEVTLANDAKRPTNDAKALSGGERSYSTVAFILALWDSTGLPFYFLDEFDVFMDKINRRVIMDILLGHAQAHPQSQFAFLTPLDTSHIIADDSITIHRLAPPERSM